MMHFFTRTRLTTSLLAGVLLLTLPLPAWANRYLAMEPMHDRKLGLDGMLREWPGGFFKLKDNAGKTTKSSALVGYDDDYVYVAAKIEDSKLVRTKGAGNGEDHLALSIYFAHSSQGPRSVSVDLFPGDPKKKLPAMVRVNGKKASGAGAVEAPSQDGFTLEAKIPWDALGPGARVGMRGKIQYLDASAPGRVSRVLSAGTGTGKAMPPLTTEPETGLIQALLEPKGLKMQPDREAYGDLTGKGGVERIALYGHFLSIVGPGYKGGKQFYFNELDVARADQVRRLEARDFSGDGRAEVVIFKRLGNPDKYREVVQVLQIGADGAPLSVFMHEVSLVTPDGRVENRVTISGKGSSTKIKIEQNKYSGFEPGTFSEPRIGGGIEPALLPWEDVSEKVYGWKGKGLALISQETAAPRMKGSAPTGAAVTRVDAPPPPRPPTSEEKLARVYALYKSDRKVSRNATPRFDFVTDVVEDEQMERVLVHDRDLVVFGKGFKGGLSYTYLTIGVQESKDVLSVTTRDLVGDGKAEILVHAVVKAQASESLGGDVVSRQALYVYKVQGETLKRIFAAETGRSLKGNRIVGSVAFVPVNSKWELELRPVRAVGWDQRTYPFPEDRHPAGGLEPLLLPWTTLGTRRYSYNGSEYVVR